MNWTVYWFDVHAHLDGTLAVYYRGQRLGAKALPRGTRRSGRAQERFLEGKRPPQTPLPDRGEPLTPARNIPSADHPWRRAAAAGARRRQLQTQDGDVFKNPLG